MNNPKISVIIPLYNHEKYINEAVYSVLEQTFSDFELIIINDGSIDRSEEIVKQIKDERIKYYYQENKGAHNTINRGIKLAKGQYIAILNSDDMYHSSRLEESLKIFEDDPSVDAVFSQLEFIDTQGVFIQFIKGIEDYLLLLNPTSEYESEGSIILDLLAGNFLVTTSNLICRKKVFEKIGLFKNLRYTHDYEFFLRLCYNFKVYIIDMPLLKYRIHRDNTIKENETETHFELGLVLSNFFLNYDLKKVFPDNDMYTNMVRFLNSTINMYNLERMIMTLVLFGLRYEEYSEFEANLLTMPGDSTIRKAFIRTFQKSYVKKLEEGSIWLEQQRSAWEKYVKKLEGGSIWLEQQRSAWEKAAGELRDQNQALNDALSASKHEIQAFKRQTEELESIVREIQNKRFL